MQWDKCLKNLQTARGICEIFLKSVLSFKGICSSRAFLQSYEITDFKKRERQATVIYHTDLYYEKVDLLIIGHLPELFKKGSLIRQNMPLYDTH